MTTIPVSAVIATRDRPAILKRALQARREQSHQPKEIVVIDSSAGPDTERVCHEFGATYARAQTAGAAAQRNQGVALATQPYICFFDDDVIFEADCFNRLWAAISSDPELGGVNAMIINQQYHSPGMVSRMMFALMNGRFEETFAGRVIGPAVNLLPEDRDDLPEIVPVEWLNLGCTMYRREALPSPPFASFFTGYSLMEDVSLSLRVAQRGWKLANARTARIFHDSQPGTHKKDADAMAKMELVNRHYLMTEIMGRKRFADYLRLSLWEVFQLTVSALRPDSRADLGRMLRGKWNAIQEIRTRARQ